MNRGQGLYRDVRTLHRAKPAIIREEERRQSERSSLVVVLSPHTCVDPPGAHPRDTSIRRLPRKVTLQQLAGHFPSLSMAFLLGVTQKGARSWNDPCMASATMPLVRPC